MKNFDYTLDDDVDYDEIDKYKEINFGECEPEIEDTSEIDFSEDLDDITVDETIVDSTEIKEASLINPSLKPLSDYKKEKFKILKELYIKVSDADKNRILSATSEIQVDAIARNLIKNNQTVPVRHNRKWGWNDGAHTIKS